MTEIKTKLIPINDGDKHISLGEEYVITENNSTTDVLRFLVNEAQGDIDGMIFLLKVIKDED